ncbi:unnamed protein product [Paramecium primaurelia]|uniref:Uncharacterized protein n=1 Tax=Paramecium primaurelia TaxID=5886 RepID=A0A8S1JQX4_PARPR|nr:unnamed protein product [Paramecium primaurelia]
MHQQIQNIQVFEKSTYSNQDANLIELEWWNPNEMKFRDVQIHITITQENNIIYSSQEGIILRKEQIYDNPNKSEILHNIEQIQYLEWLGEYGKNKRKLGKWIATWNKSLLIVGGYYVDGLKQGLWTQPFTNYFSKAKVFESGQYFHDQKYGRWHYIYKNKNIGGGSYNAQGVKYGKWLEISEKFNDDSQLTYCGEYKNGKKVGIWAVLWNDDDSWYNEEYKNKLMGGGSYDEEGDGIKQGNWLEVSDRFDNHTQVTFKGEYKNGKKVGNWHIFHKQNGKGKSIMKIGGGLYKEEEIKQGIWVELSDRFYDFSQVKYNGQYKHGKKIGRWDIFYVKEKIGGGQYDEEGDETKLGFWAEVSDRFYCNSKVTYHGQYKNGKKIGMWNILFNWQGNKQMQQNIMQYICFSGGGLYDKRGDGIKQGYWIEIWNGFFYQSQVTYSGQYKNDKKVGRWDILNEGNQIGGGSYDEEGNEMKFGRWIELANDFWDFGQLTFNGEYQDGKKVGRWVEMDLYKDEKREIIYQY